MTTSSNRDDEVNKIVDEIRREGYVPPASDSVRDMAPFDGTTPADFDTTTADAADLILAETPLNDEQLKLVAGGATEIQPAAIPADDAERAVEQGYVADPDDAGKIFMDEPPVTPETEVPVTPEVPTTPPAEEEEPEYDDEGNVVVKPEKIVTAWHSEFPMSDYSRLFEDFYKFDLDNLSTVPPVAAAVIAKWTLDGNPNDQKTYLALDVAVLSVLALEISTFFADQRARTRDVEIEYFDEYPLKKHPTILGDLERMDGMKFAELPKVLRQTIKGWNLSGSWKDKEYLWSLDAFLVAKIYSTVRTFWNQRMFKIPKR